MSEWLLLGYVALIDLAWILASIVMIARRFRGQVVASPLPPLMALAYPVVLVFLKRSPIFRSPRLEPIWILESALLGIFLAYASFRLSTDVAKRIAWALTLRRDPGRLMDIQSKGDLQLAALIRSTSSIADLFPVHQSRRCDQHVAVRFLDMERDLTVGFELMECRLFVAASHRFPKESDQEWLDHFSSQKRQTVSMLEAIVYRDFPRTERTRALKAMAVGVSIPQNLEKSVGELLPAIRAFNGWTA